MARALEIPAVVGLGKLASQVNPGDLVIIDGNRGRVLINPNEESIEEYEITQRMFMESQRSLDVLKDHILDIIMFQVRQVDAGRPRDAGALAADAQRRTQP